MRPNDRFLNHNTKQIVISRVVTFLTNNQIIWRLGKCEGPSNGSMIKIIDEDNELDAPNMIPPDHGPDNKSYTDDDDDDVDDIG